MCIKIDKVARDTMHPLFEIITIKTFKELLTLLNIIFVTCNFVY